MGLCKCPRKKVTNLFCFEHRVNVCEFCIVESHSRCVVQSYLAWLQDSDYDPNCTLCNQSLADERFGTVRLLCLHVYHWQCLDAWARRYPANTAPAGYTCPICRDGIFPKANQDSPLVKALKETLSRGNWARAGLGLPMITETEFSHTANAFPQTHNENVARNGDSKLWHQSGSTVVPLGGEGDYVHNDHSATARKGVSSGDESSYLLSSGGTNNVSVQFSQRRADTDAEENKYKRRSAFEWFRRWMSSRASESSGRVSRGWTWKRVMFFTFVAIVAILTLVTILSRLGNSVTSNDPMLDPMANPNIRIAEKMSD